MYAGENNLQQGIKERRKERTGKEGECLQLCSFLEFGTGISTEKNTTLISC